MITMTRTTDFIIFHYFMASTAIYFWDMPQNQHDQWGYTHDLASSWFSPILSMHWTCWICNMLSGLKWDNYHYFMIHFNIIHYTYYHDILKLIRKLLLTLTKYWQFSLLNLNDYVLEFRRNNLATGHCCYLFRLKSITVKLNWIPHNMRVFRVGLSLSEFFITRYPNCITRILSVTRIFFARKVHSLNCSIKQIILNKHKIFSSLRQRLERSHVINRPVAEKRRSYNCDLPPHSCSSCLIEWLTVCMIWAARRIKLNRSSHSLCSVMQHDQEQQVFL